MDLAVLRDDMVDSLEHDAKAVVHSENLGLALRNVPRHEFVDDDQQAYADTEHRQLGTRVLSPSTVGRLFEALDIKQSNSVLIIGAGPGGYSAAIRATQLGLNTVIVEKDSLGGVCLNRGCIPTKIYADVASFKENLNNAFYKGVNLEFKSFDLNRLQQYKNEIVLNLTGGVEELLLARKVEVIKGEAKFISDQEIEVNDQVYQPSNVIIATGSKAVPFSLNESEKKASDIIFNTDDIFKMESLPNQIVIIGGGVIGVEFAHIFNSLGVKVSVVELLPNLLPLEDESVSQEIHKAYEQKGIDIFTSTKVSGMSLLEEKKAKLTMVTDQSEEKYLETDCILKAVGRIPQVDGLGLENTNINYNRKGIFVNDKFQTTIPNVYAIGDIIQDSPQLAHYAYYHGEKASEIISGESMIGAKMELIPRAIFSSPEVGAVGLTEKEVANQGYDYNVSTFPMFANGRAVSKGEVSGFIKMITEKSTEEILGVHIVGPFASELVNEASLALQIECTAEEIIETIHVHPSIGEGLREAAMGIFNKSIHYG